MIIWYALGYVLAIAYIGSVVMFSITGSIEGDDWWLPLVMPVVWPLWWLHKNRVGMGIFSTGLFVLIGILVFISKVTS